MAVDLHTHSNASDGTDSPAEVIRLAASAGLTAVALTDHDTTEGLREATTAGAGLGIRVVPGIELSIEWGYGTMHVLLLFVPPEHEALEEQLEELREGRHVRNRKIVELIRRQGIPITYEEVQAVAGIGSVGRPHIARVLVDKGVVTSFHHAFEEVLGAGGWAYQPRRRLRVEELTRLVAATRGVAVLAHPHTIGFEDDWEAVLLAIEGLPLAGIEALYPTYEPAVRRALAVLAGRHGLLVSGGSDYHGRNKPDIAIGTGLGDLVVGDEHLQRLQMAAS